MNKLLLILLLFVESLMANVAIPDLSVSLQSGETKHFYSDLVKDKVVVMQFVFTQCGMICPMLGVKFSGLQKRLGDQVGTDVHLLSISIDPANDTPEKMRLWAEKFHAASGWDQVTGEKQVIDEILKSLQTFAPERDSHSTLLLLGNDRVGVWKRVDGKTSLNILDEEIQKLLALDHQ